MNASHPWSKDSSNYFKLLEAKKEARRRYDSGRLEMARECQRMKKGIPSDLPKMKPWDFVKGKCYNNKKS